ncbi:MAG: hypothetical protein ABIK89_14020 [Planctomycetota bacterium]
MHSTFQWAVAAVVVTVCVGCSEGQKGGSRVETFPLTGKVLVDGAPAARLVVSCHPQSDTGIAYALVGHTNEEGVFSISTYEAGDGLPEGEYKLTFEWPEGGGFGPPTDKLKGAYSDPKKSEHTVTVTTGEENDLGTIELTAK